MSSILIKNGTILDGMGTPEWQGDVAISGNEISVIGSSVNAQAAQVIDAGGLVVCPGFIDMHSHSDMTLPDYPDAQNMIQQGVTTEVVGHCGFSPAPVPAVFRDDFYESISFFRSSSSKWSWQTFAEYLDYMDWMEPVVNVVPLVGHNAIRSTVIGFDQRAPTDKEISRMCQELELAFDAGAWGLSTGLEYPPGCFANLHELVELARVVAENDGIYFSHIRGEGETLLDAIDELIATCEIANVSTQISHFRALGPRNWEKQSIAVRKIYSAINRGASLTADITPINANGTALMSLLPTWIKDGGPFEAKRRLRNSDVRRELKAQLSEDCLSWANIFSTTGFQDIYIFGCPKTQSHLGKSLLDIAIENRKDPRDVVMDLVAEHGAEIFVVFETLSESNIRQALREQFTMVGSDGWAHPSECDECSAPHPRSYGSFPRVLGQFVREQKAFSLSMAVHKMTGKSASRLGLRDRGQLRAGRKADIVIFDPAKIADRSSMEAPQSGPVGIHWVIVNGTVAVGPEGVTGERAGSVIRRQV